jgi:hypothetical protein
VLRGAFFNTILDTVSVHAFSECFYVYPEFIGTLGLTGLTPIPGLKVLVGYGFGPYVFSGDARGTDPEYINGKRIAYSDPDRTDSAAGDPVDSFPFMWIIA